MTDDRLTAELAAIKARADAATRGPWWFDEDDEVFRLHGVHAIIPPVMDGFPEQVLNHQILKAPKQGTPYAEYWPGEADAAFIVAARADVPRLLAAVDALIELHRPIDRGRVMACCEGCEAVNGEFHGGCCHEWPCPTYEAILAALTGKAADGG